MVDGGSPEGVGGFVDRLGNRVLATLDSKRYRGNPLQGWKRLSLMTNGVGEPMSDVTPKVVFEERIASGLTANADKAKEINASYLFKIAGDDGGQWILDLTVPEVRPGEDGGADCTIHMESTDFIDMIEGRLPGAQAFMTGKLRIEGDMGLAMKLQEIFAMQQS
jgi:putative sterol carrier protein